MKNYAILDCCGRIVKEFTARNDKSARNKVARWGYDLDEICGSCGDYAYELVRLEGDEEIRVGWEA